jgi:hypothetical protein
LKQEVGVRSSQLKKMRTGPGKKKKKKETSDQEPKKQGKKMTKWNDSKLSKKEIEELDRSKEVLVTLSLLMHTVILI